MPSSALSAPAAAVRFGRMARRGVAVLAAVATLAAVAGCATTPTGSSPVRVGWTDPVPALDPALATDPVAAALLFELYPTLVESDGASLEVTPGIAAEAGFTDAAEYTVVLQPGLQFANGDDLTASDVVFSFERQLALEVPGGAWRQLGNLTSVEAVDETTVVFHLATDDDATFPFVLAGVAGLVLDEEVFFADTATDDVDIVAAQAFAGPYTIADDDAEWGDRVPLQPFDGYAGGRPAASEIDLRFGTAADLAGELASGSLDVLTGVEVDADAVALLADDSAIDLVRAGAGQLRGLQFDFARMPFGTRTEEADADAAETVRRAIADALDRAALASTIGGNWLATSDGYLPLGLPGFGAPLDALGDGSGGPDLELAAADLERAGIGTPLEIEIHVVPETLGGPALAEAQAIATQLEASDLFRVTVTEHTVDGFVDARAAGEVGIVLAGIQPLSLDPAAYLTPFSSASARSSALGFANETVDSRIAGLATELDPEVREELLASAQQAIAAALPALATTQSVRLVFSRSTVDTPRLADSVPLELGSLRR